MAKKIRVWDGSVWQDVATGMASGVSTAGGSTVTASAASVVPLILKGATSQTADLLSIQNSAGAQLLEVNNSGRLIINAPSSNGPSVEVVNTNGTNGTIVARGVSATDGVFIQAQSNNFYSVPSYTMTGIGQYSQSTTGTTLGLANAGLGHVIFQNSTAGAIYTNGGAPIVFGTTSAERMRIDSSGNVMINTTSATSATGYGSLTINGTTGVLFSLKVGGTETFRIQPTSTVTTINGIANIPIVFNTNNTEAMRISAAGNVGIGGVPTYKLDVSSTARVGGSVTNAGTSLIANGQMINYATVNWNYGNLELMRNVSNTSTPRFIGMLLDGDSLTATTIGAYNSIWGIYDSAPTTGSISSTLNSVMAYGAYAGHRWYTNGTERMRIDSIGQVGIGPIVSGAFNKGLSINSESGQYAGIQLVNSSTGSATSDGSALYISNSALVLSNREASTLTLATNNADRMTIASDGITTFSNVIYAPNFNSSITTAQSGVNFNTIINSGFYRMNTGLVNGPGMDWGQLLVIHGGADTITQIYGDYNSGSLFTRSGNPSDVGGGGSWQSWRQVVDTINGGKLTAAQTTTDARIRNIYTSTSAPSGGLDGDMWAVYV